MVNLIIYILARAAAAGLCLAAACLGAIARLARRGGAAMILLALALSARAGTLTGRFLSPTAGVIANATLTLSLSQAAIEPGSAAIVPTLVSCYTSVDGTVVGVANPPAAPIGGAFGIGGTLPAGVYFVDFTYTGPGGSETLPSPELQLSLGSAGRLQINAPTAPPAAATGFNVYIGTSAGTETKQGTSSLLTNYVQSSPLASGSAPPLFNTTVCGLVFNDAAIPAFTYYNVSLSDSAGNVMAGYPQNWYLAGTAVDVSNITPLASNPAVRFPMPVLSNPASGTAQSVASSLYLNSIYGISGSNNVGPGYFSQFWSGNLPATNSTLGQWTPNVGVVVQRIDVNAQTAGSGGTNGTSISISDGTNTCTFSHLLVATAASTSSAQGLGTCVFNGQTALTVKVAGDDHAVMPANIGWVIEMTSK